MAGVMLAARKLGFLGSFLRAFAAKQQRRPTLLPPLGAVAGGDPQGFDAFKADRSSRNVRGMILTTPKAGTYLVAKVLQNLGLVDLEVHLSETQLSDYRNMSLEEKVAQAQASIRYIPLDVSARMILPGQFAVGHLVYTPSARTILAPFMRILCLREIRHALVSFMRFELRRIAADPMWLVQTSNWANAPDDVSKTLGYLALNGEAYLTLARSIHRWTEEPGVITCRFEDLVGENGTTAQRRSAEMIALACGMSADAGMQALAASLGRPTLTFSGRRTTLEGFWDASVEAAFRRIGGLEANDLLGYGNSAWD